MKNIVTDGNTDTTHEVAVDNASRDKTGLVFIEISGVSTVDVGIRYESGGTKFPIQTGITTNTAIPVVLSSFVYVEVDYTSGSGVTANLQD